MYTIDQIIIAVNAAKVRVTYSAVAELLGIHPLAIGKLLGDHRPEASWIVSKTTGMPTDYMDKDLHVDLQKSQEILETCPELMRLLEDFYRITDDWIGCISGSRRCVMKTGTGIFLGLVVLSMTSMFDVTLLEKNFNGAEVTQYHLLRHNTLTGKIDACVVSFSADADDPSWASCDIVMRELQE